MGLIEITTVHILLVLPFIQIYITEENIVSLFGIVAKKILKIEFSFTQTVSLRYCQKLYVFSYFLYYALID